MPLRKGSSQSVVSSNIKTLVDARKKDGSIGTSHPPTKKKAIKQAVAIAFVPARIVLFVVKTAVAITNPLFRVDF